MEGRGILAEPGESLIMPRWLGSRGVKFISTVGVQHLHGAPPANRDSANQLYQSGKSRNYWIPERRRGVGNGKEYILFHQKHKSAALISQLIKLMLGLRWGQQATWGKSKLIRLNRHKAANEAQTRAAGYAINVEQVVIGVIKLSLFSSVGMLSLTGIMSQTKQPRLCSCSVLTFQAGRRMSKCHFYGSNEANAQKHKDIQSLFSSE